MDFRPCHQCCVCENRYGEVKSVSFHLFPKSVERRMKWVAFVQRSTGDDKWEPGAHSRICSHHFLTSDYERTCLEDLANLKLKNVLTRAAIPTVINKQSGPANLLATDPCGEENIVASPHVPSDTDTRKYAICSLKSEAAGLAVDLANANQKIDDLKKVAAEKEKELRKEIADMRRHQERERLLFKAQLEKYEEHHRNMNQLVNERDAKLKVAGKQIRKLQRTAVSRKKMLKQKELMSEMKKKLAPVLTANQIDLITGRKKQVKWTKSELETAFTLRYFGIGQYNFLRQQINFPLPSLTTLRRYSSHIDLKAGLLTDVINMLKLTAEKDPRSRVTVLSYDEMRINSSYEYDLKDDEVLGPHKYLQVIMARGLFSKWKTPVYVGFDVNVTKTILETVITALHQVECEVVACVSDMGTSNQGLWKQLGVDMNQTFFHHPSTNNKIWMFADVPHLLKLTRNWLLDSGKNPKIAMASRANTIDREDEVFVATTVFKKADVAVDVDDILGTNRKPLALSQPTNGPIPQFHPPSPFPLEGTTSTTLTYPDVVDDGLEYALGFVARKFQKKEHERTGNKSNDLGHYSYQWNRWDHDYCSTRSYVGQLSHGGLTVPTQQFLEEGRMLLAKMKEVHGDSFSSRKKVVEGSVSHLRQFSSLPIDVLTTIVKLFIKFRIERLNREARAASRKRIYDSRAKSAAKLRKLV